MNYIFPLKKPKQFSKETTFYFKRAWGKFKFFIVSNKLSLGFILLAVFTFSCLYITKSKGINDPLHPEIFWAAFTAFVGLVVVPIGLLKWNEKFINIIFSFEFDNDFFYITLHSLSGSFQANEYILTIITRSEQKIKNTSAISLRKINLPGNDYLYRYLITANGRDELRKDIPIIFKDLALSDDQTVLINFWAGDKKISRQVELPKMTKVIT